MINIVVLSLPFQDQPTLSKKQSTLSELFSQPNSRASTSTASLSASVSALDPFIFNREMCVWFCQDLVSFSTVEKPGFVRFCKRMLPDQQLPHRTTLSSSCLRDIYNLVKDKVTQDLKEATTICLMFDGWSDKHHGAHYMGLKCKFIRKDWTPVVVTLPLVFAQKMAKELLIISWQQFTNS
jgi:hypothetical protein